jgi:hypothetical protein
MRNVMAFLGWLWFMYNAQVGLWFTEVVVVSSKIEPFS